MARTIIFFGCVPVTMKPPISTLSPVSTRKRVEMFPRIAGEALGVGVGVGVAEGVGVSVGVGVGVAVGKGVGVGVIAAAQYLLPVFKPGYPPQTIISLPVQTTV